MSDFEEVNWTEDKEYEFDGFEEVVLPDLEDEEEIQKMAPLPRNKKRRECHPHEKSLDSKSSKGKDSGNVLEAWSPQPGNKDPGKAGDLVEDDLEQKEDPHTPDPSKAELAVSAGASGRRPCLPPAACEEGQTWGSVLSPGPDHSMSEGDEIESAASRFRMETPSSLVGSTNETCGLPAEGEGGNSSTQRGEGGEEEADRGGVMRHTAAEGAPGSRENTSRSQGGDWARLRPQAPTTKDQERRVAATRDQSHQEVGTLGEGVSWRAEEEGSPGSASLQPGGHASVKFASASAQVRFQSCQKLSDLSPIDLRLTLARRALPDRSFQSSREDETALGTSARESPAVSLALGPSSENSPLQAESDEHYSQAQAAVCAQNTRLSSTGERVVLWTREADRAILTACRESGANEETFREVAQQLNSKSAQEVSQRFRELMWLFHTSGDASTDEEEDIMSSSNPEQLSDRPVSDEEQD
ncbi:GON-4-like protein [Chiloscyllium plagiosum]|uniref:GON-4-like protein n=1 Tax=Chiloscyllium plagiosum TaxID=36176 RepID=UPI001CB824AF|nr:GON-4-like protein [Chiloscyllium plagiosum]